ncbi:MAG: hypothetical protein LBM77_01530, partial [Spirochaetaceae bacterium]|nr:hypothetical protein [Spirochaetaceae bacterium]
MKKLLLCALFASFVVLISAQDFGFGFDDEASGDDSGFASFTNSLGATIGGEIQFGLFGYYDEMIPAENMWRPGILLGKLNVEGSSNAGKAIMKVKLNPAGFWPPGNKDYQYDVSNYAALNNATNFANLLAIDELYAVGYIG